MNVTIQFTCPQCSHTMNLPSSAEGKQGKCPSCSAVVTIVTSVAETPDDVALHVATDPLSVAPRETETNALGLGAIDPAMEVLSSQSDPPAIDPLQIPLVHETPLVDTGSAVETPVNFAVPEMTNVQISSDNRRPARKDATWKPRIPLILASVAMALSFLALCFTLFSDPLGKGLGAFDFSTPEDALMSRLKITAETHIRAEIELNQLLQGAEFEEKLKTCEVHKTSTYQGKKLLFISFKENGLTQYSVHGFEKHADTGFWFPKYFSRYDMDDSGLQTAIEKWEARSEGEEGTENFDALEDAMAGALPEEPDESADDADE